MEKSILSLLHEEESVVNKLNTENNDLVDLLAISLGNVITGTETVDTRNVSRLRDSTYNQVEKDKRLLLQIRNEIAETLKDSQEKFKSFKATDR